MTKKSHSFSTKIFRVPDQRLSWRFSANASIICPHPSTTMNFLALENITPAPLESHYSLSLEDVAPFLRSTSRKFLFHDEDDESQNMSEDIVPGEADIICGKDNVAYNHAGNKKFRAIVIMHGERYKRCPSRHGKTLITTEIIKSIRARGGRFLRMNKKINMYEDLSDQKTHDKVSHALRSAKDPNEKKVPRKRNRVRNPPTPQENKAFEFLFREQQRIFQELLVQRTAETAATSQEDWQNEVIVRAV